MAKKATAGDGFVSGLILTLLEEGLKSRLDSVNYEDGMYHFQLGHIYLDQGVFTVVMDDKYTYEIRVREST